MNTLRASLLILLFAFSASSSGEELSAEKRADTERLLEMTGALALGQQMGGMMVKQMTQMLHQARPDIPQSVLDVLPGEVNAVIGDNLSSFKELMVVLYHRHFTGGEIKGLIRFYSTDLGRKTIRVMPALLNESVQVGQKWGQALGPALEERIKARFQKEGYKL